MLTWLCKSAGDCARNTVETSVSTEEGTASAVPPLGASTEAPSLTRIGGATLSVEPTLVPRPAAASLSPQLVAPTPNRSV
jgi:hypothetical protein